MFRNSLTGNMATCNHEQTAFEYLTTPENVLHRYFHNLIENDTKDLNDKFCSEVVACYKEMVGNIGKIKGQTKGDLENWFSDQRS
jgi:hypothetical protein